MYNSGAGLVASRALAIIALADNTAFKQSQYDSAFVLTEYFGYLRRDPDDGGYNFWLKILNAGEANNYRGMVCVFITAREYEGRFSSVVNHTNAECAP